MIKLQPLFPAHKKAINDQNGMILASVLILIVVFTIIGMSLSSYAISHYAITSKDTFTANATLVAEAGVEQSLQKLNENDTFPGYASEQVFFNDPVQGRGVFTVTIADSTDSNAKIVTSTGKVYRYNKTTDPVSTRIVKVTTVGTKSEGYSVLTGPGGLILGGSASITNSDVYVNGTLTLNGAAKIGTAAQPLDVKVANQSCPTGASPGATYPQVCASGQPISLQQSTMIYGTVCATGQTSVGPKAGGNILPGSTGQGLVNGCVAPVITQPSFDKTAQVNAVTTTASGTSNTYVCNSWPFTRNWPANLKLTGNVSVGGSCDVTINGNVYITGDLTINGASKITVSNTVGTNRPYVLVDGKISINGSTQIIANNVGTGIHFISVKSSAACNPNCTTLSGNDLKTSQGLETINVGGAVNLPGMIFQAYWGKVTLGGSGNVGSAVGQTVDLSGAGTVTFGTQLSSGSRTWTVSSYQQKFPD